VINQENLAILTRYAKPLHAIDGNLKKDSDFMSDPYVSFPQNF